MTFEVFISKFTYFLSQQSHAKKQDLGNVTKASRSGMNSSAGCRSVRQNKVVMP